MRRSVLIGVLPCLAFAAVLASAREAHAGPYIGADFDLGTAFQNRVDFSYGLGGRFGYKIYFPRTAVWLLPEVGGHFMSFGPNPGVFDHAGKIFTGVRFGMRGVVQPNVFAHLDLGFVGGSDLGPAADIGAGVDFRITPVFSLGLQLAYNAVTITSRGDAAKWLSFGLNIGFDLGPHRRDHRRAFRD